MSLPLFTLHGFTGRASDWDEHRPALALSLSGHAGGAPIAPDWRFTDEVDRVAREIASRGGRGPVHLAGYSMGARVALAVAAAHPALVARLTLVGVHPGLEREAERAERRDLDERWCTLLEQRGIEDFVLAWEAQPMWRSQDWLPGEVRDRQRAARLAHDPHALAASLRALGLGAMPDLWPELAGITAPVALLAGAVDEKFAALAHRIVGRMPRASAVLVDGAGHNLLLEAPDAVARALGPDEANQRRAS